MKSDISNTSQLTLRIFVVIIAIAIGFFTLKMVDQNNIKLTIVLLFVPIIIFYMALVFADPILNLITLFIANYFVVGLTRYIPAPLGLSLDALLALTLFALWLYSFYKHVPWERAKSDITLVAVIWFAFTVVQLANPLAESRTAWFYAMRGIGLHMFLMVPLTLVLLRKHSQINIFLLMWAIFSILAALKGIVQIHVGLDFAEQRWLDSEGYSTHILFGRLRAFSFMADAGTYGATMGHSAIVFGILAVIEKANKKLRLLYVAVFILSFYGMSISGTRGAIAVPFGGLLLYIIIRRNAKTLILGGLIGLFFFSFLRFTTIGNSNYTIYRMRTSVVPSQDASLQVRLNNQRTLRAYMKGKPFGVGVGASGNWGLRFSPYTIPANTPTDSWYVMIFVEQGIVGLIAHLALWLYVIIKGAYLLMVAKINQSIKNKLQALLAGVFGILVASYANSYLGQMPIGIICYISVALVFVCDKIEDDVTLIENET